MTFVLRLWWLVKVATFLPVRLKTLLNFDNFAKKLEKMTEIEFDDVKKQIEVIESLIPKYGGKTIDNILYGLKCRVKEYMDNNKKIKINNNGRIN